MGKRTGETAPPHIYFVIGKIRPPAATGYRLVDIQNRLFPPQEQPPYQAKARIDVPLVPAGQYGIRFEDLDGNVVPYTEDGALAEILLDGDAVTQTPDELEVRQERGWQKVEKKEVQYKAEHIRNQGLQAVTSLLFQSQEQIFKSHEHVNKLQQTMSENLAQMMELQKQMLQHQASINQQSQSIMPAPPQENWPSAVSKIMETLGNVAKVVVNSHQDTGSPRGPSRARLEGQENPSPRALPPTESPPVRETEKRRDPPDASAAAPKPAAAPQQLSFDLARPGPTNQTPRPRAAEGPEPPSAARLVADETVPKQGNKDSVLTEQEQERADATKKPTMTESQLALREIKRRIISIPDSASPEVLAIKESLVSLLAWIGEPALTSKPNDK